MTEVTITMPLNLTPEMIRAVRDDPTTCTADRDAWHARLGWLMSAWDVLVQYRRMPSIPASGIMMLSEEQYAEVEACLTTPQEPTPALRQGLAILREMTNDRAGR